MPRMKDLAYEQKVDTFIPRALVAADKARKAAKGDKFARDRAFDVKFHAEMARLTAHLRTFSSTPGGEALVEAARRAAEMA